MTHDTVVMRRRLRAETAAMLKLDVNNLTPAQSIRLDRAATLRLELNDIEERKLIGAPFDMVKYVAASEALERMLGGDPEQQHQPVDQFSGAREELLHFLDGRAEAIARRDERIKAEAASNGSRDLLPKGEQIGGLSQNPPKPSPSPVAELLPADQEPPTSNVHHSYIDNDVIEPSPLRHHSMNNAAGQSRPPTQRLRSPVTAAYFGNAPGGSLNLGGSPWRTRDWNPRRGF